MEYIDGKRMSTDFMLSYDQSKDIINISDRLSLVTA